MRLLILTLISFSLYANDYTSLYEDLNKQNFKRVYKELTSNPGNDATYFELLGTSAFFLGKLEEAKVSFRASLKLKQSPRVWLSLIKTLESLGEHQSASKELVLAKKAFPKDITLSNLTIHGVEREGGAYNKAIALYNSKEYSKTLQICTDELKKDSRNKPFLQLRAASLVKLGQYKKAIEDYSVLSKIEPHNSNYSTVLFHLSLQTGSIKKAESILKELESQKKETAEDHLELAQKLIQAGQLDKGRKELLKALEKQPGSIAILEYLGYLDAKQGHLKDSIRDYRKLISLGRNNIQYYLALEQNYGSLGEQKAAIKTLEEALKVYPHNSSLLTRLAYYSELNGDYDRSEDLYQNALSIDSQNEYAKKALQRLNGSSTEVFIDVKATETANRFDHVSGKEADEFRQFSSNLQLSHSFKRKHRLGLNYSMDEFKKEGSLEHKVEKDTILSHYTYSSQLITAYLALGFNKLDGNSVGSGYQGKDDFISSSLYLAKQLGRHDLSLSSSLDEYVFDNSLSLSLEKYKMYSLQDRIQLTGEASLSLRSLFADGENSNYRIYSLTPRLVLFNKVLTAYLNVDRIDLENGEDYFQEHIGALFELQVRKLRMSLDNRLGYRHSDQHLLLNLDGYLEYSFSDSISGVFTAEFASEYGDQDINNLGGSLGLRCQF